MVNVGCQEKSYTQRVQNVGYLWITPQYVVWLQNSVESRSMSAVAVTLPAETVPSHVPIDARTLARAIAKAGREFAVLRFAGCMWMSCPKCGNIAMYHVSYKTIRVRCTNPACHRWYSFRLQLVDRTGRKPGEHMDDETYPIADVVRWQRGLPMLELVEGETYPPYQLRRPKRKRLSTR